MKEIKLPNFGNWQFLGPVLDIRNLLAYYGTIINTHYDQLKEEEKNYMNIHFLNKTAKFFNGPSANHNKDAKDRTTH